MTVYQFLPLLALFINGVLASLVLFGHARQRSHVVFALFLASMALWGGAIYFMRASATLEDAFFWEKLVLVNFYLISVSFLHFTYIFSGVRPRRWILPAAYGLTGLVILLSLGGLVAEGMQQKFYGYAPVGGPLLFLYLALSYGVIGLALKNILSVYRQPLSQAQRNRAGYLIIGAAFSMLGTITDLLPLTGLPVYPLGIVGNILFAVVASIAMLRYRLLDINVVLRRVVGYLLVFISLAGVSVLGSLILHRAIDTTFLTVALATISLMILSHALLSILLGKVQPGIDRVFYRGRWASLRELQQFTTETKNLSDHGSLAQSLIQLVERAMGSQLVVLMQPDAGPDAPWATVSVGSEAEISLPFDNKSTWLQRMARDDRPYLEREMRALPEWQYVPASLRTQLETLEIKVFVPLVNRQELIGLLLLGAKESGRSYSLEELNLLQAVAAHAATSMENARLYEEAHLQLQELKDTQAQLIQSGKLASVGTLAAGVAHEVNNPVFAIMGMTELLLSNRESHLKSAQAEEYLNVIAEMSDRIAKVVQGMLVFSRNEQTPTLVSLNQVMEDTLRLMEHKLRVSGLTLEKVYCPVLPPARAVANKLQQALMNLIINASDAMAEGGTLTLTTGVTGDQVWLSCKDTGSGISQKDLERIFDAFFTTKPVGKGTGLGLHITHRIVEECGGEIRVESELGRGTTFTICVPIAEPEFEAPDFDDQFLFDDEWQDQTAGSPQ